MAAKVFISCGQRPGRESAISKHLEDFFRSKGYDPYVAIQIQTILDLNSGIIGALKECDYYLFVNFARETVAGEDSCFRRGSIYSHQELAAAYALGFEQFLFLNEAGVQLEGMQQFIVSNTPDFHSEDELFAILDSSLEKLKWSPTYSRHLRFGGIEIPGSGIINYHDHTTLPGGRLQKHFLGTVENRRQDLGALNTTARLTAFKDANDIYYQSPDQSPLKASYTVGYSHTIFPNSSQCFDLFALHLDSPGMLFLNSSLDFQGRTPIISTPGDYILFYSVFSAGFPVLNFQISIHLDGCTDLTKAITVSSASNQIQGFEPTCVPAY